jgi:hypothetical protein
MDIYQIARKFYEKLSYQRESNLLFLTGFCSCVELPVFKLNGNMHQFNPRRFYPFYGAESKRRHTRKIDNKRPISQKTDWDKILRESKKKNEK